MMKATTSTGLVLAASLLSVSMATSVDAQSPNYGAPRGARQPQSRGLSPAGRPGFSPYLNLLRQGNSTALNYYGLVRPEQEFREFNQLSQFNQEQLERGLRGVKGGVDDGSERTVSGHRASFLSDLRGGAGSTVQTLRERDNRLDGLQRSPQSTLAPTGHNAYFGNTGTYFPNPR